MNIKVVIGGLVLAGVGYLLWERFKPLREEVAPVWIMPDYRRFGEEGRPVEPYELRKPPLREPVPIPPSYTTYQAQTLYDSEVQAEIENMRLREAGLTGRGGII